MRKIIFSLLWNRASINEWKLQLGAHLLREGSGLELGKVLSEQQIGPKRFAIVRVVGLTYHFGNKKIQPLTARKNIRLK